MSSTEKTPLATRETIPPHLFSRIENEWQQMRAGGTSAPRFDMRPAGTARD